MIPVDSSSSHVAIGSRLRAARKRSSLTLEQLALATGLSKGYISRVERDQSSPTVHAVAAMCDTLGISVGELFRSARTEFVRLSDAPRVSFGGKGIREWQVSPRSELRLQVLRAEIDPGATSGEALYGVECEVELVHLMEGSLELSFPGVQYDLLVGDTVTFPGSEPHSWHNPGRNTAVALFVLSHAESRG